MHPITARITRSRNATPFAPNLNARASIQLIALVACLLMSAFAGRTSAQTTAPAQQPTQSTDPKVDGKDEASTKKTPRSHRSFDFKYGVSINDLKEGQSVRVWMPLPPNNNQQRVTYSEVGVPNGLQLNFDRDHANKIGYFKTKAPKDGQIKFHVDFGVTRQEAMVYGAERELTYAERVNFLRANRMVPIDGKPVELLKDKKMVDKPLQAGKQLYEIVEDHMKYDKSQPGYGNGDSVWACDSKTGNCTDFHSLFISLARSQKIPARFEIGFPLPADKTEGTIGGYHCWAWFHAKDHGWVPVDISEADKHPEMKDYYFGKLTADRIQFSMGRDIQLVPKSAAGPLNYFVYPHVEVDGEVWPKEKIELNFSFKNKAEAKSK